MTGYAEAIEAAALVVEDYAAEVDTFHSSAGSFVRSAAEHIRALTVTDTAANAMREAATIDSVYAQARDNHARYSATGDRETDIRFFALGLTGEAGEVANFVKKRWRDGEGHDDDLRKECADVFAYNIMLADALGMTPQDLIDMVAHKQTVFVAKMQARAALPGDSSPARAAKAGEIWLESGGEK